jgi:hypothetical protein
MDVLYGYGHPNAHYFKCNQLFECYHANAVGSWNFLELNLHYYGVKTVFPQQATKVELNI